MIGVVLLIGAYKTLQVAKWIYDEPAHPQAPAYGKRHSGLFLPIVVGCGLLVGGAVCVLAGALPGRFVEKLIRVPKFTLWENPGRDNPRGPWR